jgi:hypothetical protein
MELLFKRKGIHYFFLTDQNGAPVQYIFTDTMIANNMYIEFREALFEIELQNNEDEDEDELDDDDDTQSPGDENRKPEFEEFAESSLIVSAIINNEGMDYYIFMQSEVPVSKMIIYTITLHIADILENCPVNQFHDYLDEMSTSHYSAKQVKKFNRESTLTRDILKRIAHLRQLRDEKLRSQN